MMNTTDHLFTKVTGTPLIHFLRFFSMVACCLLAVEKSWALCTADSGDLPFPDTIVVPRDTAIGAVIASAERTGVIMCDNDGSDFTLDRNWFIGPSRSTVDYGSSEIADVRKTMYPGIGIRWTGQTPGVKVVFSSSSLDSGLLGTLVQTSGGAQIRDTVEFVRIPGELKSQVLAPWTFNLDYRTETSNMLPPTALYSVRLRQTPFKFIACDVLNSAITAPLGNVEKRAFNGPGTTAGEHRFDIPLNCDAGAQVSITLDATPHSSGAPGVLALDAAGSDGVAKGIGILISQNDTPITLGSPVSVGTTASSGSFLVPMKVNYYQAESDISPGQANGTATFTMTYN